MSLNAARIAVLMTCHNRREITLACLDSLSMQQFPDSADLRIYLVDDGCTDGTAEAVKTGYPSSVIVRGDGRLYWCGGMRTAFGVAQKDKHDYYLWLNDDVRLFRDAIHKLLMAAQQVRAQVGHEPIVVGSTCDPETGERTYGGSLMTAPLHPMSRLMAVQPSDKPRYCDIINGNCVLIPHQVADVVGNLSPRYSHCIGDTDYGLRAKARGISSWICPGYVGTCRRNPKAVLWADPDLPLRERLRALYSPKGRPPREMLAFARQHAGYRWPVCLLRLYGRAMFPRLWQRLKEIRA